MATHCVGTQPLLFLAEDPRQVVASRADRGFLDVVRPNDGVITFYQWMTFSLMNLTQVCQTSPIDYLEASTRLSLQVGEFTAYGRPAVRHAMDFDHVGYDSRKREATLRAAATAGAKYVVVGKWGGSWADTYDLVEMSGSRSGGFSISNRISNRVSGALVRVEFHVHDAKTGAPVFRKQYTAFEENRFAVTGSTRPPIVHTAEIRRAILESLIADIARAMTSPGSLRATNPNATRLDIPAATQIVLSDTRSLAQFATISVSLVKVERQDRFTRFELQLQNRNANESASIALRTTKIGPMAFAKSASGEVFMFQAGAKAPQVLNLRPGESGTFPVTLQNELGPLGMVALYVDLDLQVGRLRDVRRVTFPNLHVN